VKRPPDNTHLQLPEASEASESFKGFSCFRPLVLNFVCDQRSLNWLNRGGEAQMKWTETMEVHPPGSFIVLLTEVITSGEL